MAAGEIFRFMIEKLLHGAPRSLDEELDNLIRLAPGPIHSLSLLAHYRGPGAPCEYWIDGAFHEPGRKSTGLPTFPMRKKVPFGAPAELSPIWDWMIAAKAARNIPALYLKEYWYASASALDGEALIEANLASALETLSAPLLSLRAETWEDDRGLGSGVNLHAVIASKLPGAEDPVSASLYRANDSDEQIALIRGWAEGAAARHNVPFRFD